jgi:hypothetical protein
MRRVRYHHQGARPCVEETRTLIAYARRRYAEDRWPLSPELRPVREALANLDTQFGLGTAADQSRMRRRPLGYRSGAFDPAAGTTPHLPKSRFSMRFASASNRRRLSAKGV